MKINRHKIELLLAKNCLSLTKAAELSNMSRQSIAGILKRRYCRPATIGRIARALNVDVLEILEDEEV